MKNLLYMVFLLFVSLNLGAIEKTLILGASEGWGAVEKRVQVEERTAVRPHAVLVLSSALQAASQAASQAGRLDTTGASDQDGILALYAAYRNFPVQESSLDLDLSFDEGRPDRFADKRGNYRISVSGAAQSVNERTARYGLGAVLFTGEDRYSGAPVTIKPASSALFAPGRSVRDFSIEFWLYPNSMENGEQIIAWTAAENQRILCEAFKNRTRWTFQELFASPEKLSSGTRTGNAAGGRPYMQGLVITLESRAVIIPRRWSHHLIRYNADTGLLEYLVDGRIENMAYTTANGREGGNVYTPFINRDGAFVLGGRFSGMMDEFRIYNRVINVPGRTAPEQPGKALQDSQSTLELPDLAKFPRGGGRIETRSIDLGKPGSTVVRIETSGGRIDSGNRDRNIKNIYAGKTIFNFPDASTLQFFIRAGEDQYRFNQSPWIPFIPGETLSVNGRYIQVAAAFYPSGDCSTSPYLEELRIIYNSNEPPYPPSLVSARALDGAVELSWRVSPDEDVRGYLIYYGTSSGVYYGQGAVLGISPIDAGNRTFLRIEGLQNGTLYFFAIVAYNGTGLRPDGKFSREVSARPLRSAP